LLFSSLTFGVGLTALLFSYGSRIDFGTEILERHEQHSKTLSVVLSEFFVMHLVCPPDRSKIEVVAVAKPLKALMDEDVVNEEIAHPVGCDAKANRRELRDFQKRTKHDKSNSRRSKDKKKVIVLFEK